ncbi:MAG: class I SAM-dependent methyltransferase [Bacteroidetes bacterium]|nr:class I SAM-dependent methyltransferase [Bacteroidota bacterium]MBS1539924.1 class I SAM-dependent methyltransferase [Bacteroidota bacterium]
MQTEKPYWLTEAYQNPINLTDTGIVLRNLRLSRIVTSLLVLFFDHKKEFVDYAGGFGLFTRLMRDKGFDFYWTDPFTKNELARGFESAPDKKYHVATSFESFEHFENPSDELQKIVAIADNIILSTELLPQPIPRIHDWWYYAPEHGQHIAFYTKVAFQKLAEKNKKFYYNLDNVHLLTERKLSWLAELLLKFKYAKHLLFTLSFPCSLLLKSKTFDDADELKAKAAP